MDGNLTMTDKKSQEKGRMDSRFTAADKKMSALKTRPSIIFVEEYMEQYQHSVNSRMTYKDENTDGRKVFKSQIKSK